MDLKSIISNVNTTLGYYDSGFTSLKRYPSGEKERINSFRQYIECRLNMELAEISELYEIVNDFEGHLFEVTLIEDPDEQRRRFSLVTAEINKNPNDYLGSQEFLEVIEIVKNVIGGSKIKFSSSPKRMKLFIE